MWRDAPATHLVQHFICGGERPRFTRCDATGTLLIGVQGCGCRGAPVNVACCLRARPSEPAEQMQRRPAIVRARLRA